MSSLSLAISTVGRPTLIATIDSILLAPEFSKENIEICVFANGNLPEEISVKLEELNTTHKNFIYKKSDYRLPMWESRRAGLALATKDFVWILGDDDCVIPGAINEVLRFVEKREPQLISLNGIWSNYKGNTGPLPKSNCGSFTTKNLSKILVSLNKTLNTLDVGRVVVSRELNNIWSSQPGTVDETWHEEYRALYMSICSYISAGKPLTVCELASPAVVLGKVEKSWADSYKEARLGQIRMLQNLPNEFLPGKTRVFKKEKSFYFSLRHQLSLRIMYGVDSQAPTWLKPTVIQLAKLWLANATPSIVLRVLRKFI
jgi:hypothetical protein